MLLENVSILMVEDDELLTRMYEKRLLIDGAKVTVAVDGEDALEKLGKEKVDIILLDLMMPKVNGYEVLRRIKHNPLLKDIPIIVLTNLDAHPEYVEQAAGAKVEEYLVKSNTSMDEVVRKIFLHVKKK